MKEQIIYKQANINLEPDNNVEGLLIGYANTYNVKDLQGDISAPTSFVKTVTENKSNIKIYRNHDLNQFVGVPMELDITDPKGLRLTAKMALEIEQGRNAYLESKFLVENGFQSGFSIGGWVMKRDKNNKSIVTEYKLNEISVLTTDPANTTSMVDMVKSINVQDKITQEEFWRISIKAYNEQGFSDEILKSLENTLTLISKPSLLEDGTLKHKPSDLQLQYYNQLLKR